MEHCYIVIYDLCSPGQNYEELYKKLKSFPHWGKLSESAWAIISSLDAVAIRDCLSLLIDKNDRLFVVRSGTEAAWQNMFASNEWIKKNIIR